MTDKRSPVERSAPVHREESTTPDLEELTRRLVDAANRRNVAAMMSLFAPDAVWHALGLGDERLQGTTAIRAMLEDWFRPYVEYEVAIEELLDLGDGVAFAVAVNKGRPINSNASVQWRQGFVVLMDDDSIARVVSYRDLDEARADAERLAEERSRRCRRKASSLCVRPWTSSLAPSGRWDV